MKEQEEKIMPPELFRMPVKKKHPWFGSVENRAARGV
jgi:hypothetical protein